MDAKEIRLGNLILKGGLDIDTGGIKEEVTEVNYHVLYDVIGRPTNYQPIPLTEDWLLKLGFGLFPWGWVNKEAGRSLRITIQYNFEREGNTSLKVNYVHQLQNLYFALTDEELLLSNK